MGVLWTPRHAASHPFNGGHPTSANVAVMPSTEADTSVPKRTFSVPEIAAALCGQDTTTSRRWVSDHLRGYAEPTLPGFKAQGRWRMTQADLEQSIELLRPKRDEPTFTSMTNRSRKRVTA